MKVDQKNSKGLMAEFRSLNRCERLVCLVTAWDGGYVNESSGSESIIVVIQYKAEAPLYTT